MIVIPTVLFRALLRRLSDGNYAEALYAGDIVQPVALPWVSIDLDALFAYGEGGEEAR